MEPLPGQPIRPVDDVVREYVEGVLSRHPDVARYRLALELGWSPSTLERRIREWEDGETVLRDRR